MQFLETVLAGEFDRVISSTLLRIEQQRIHVRESSGSPAQVTVAQGVLDNMLKSLQRLQSQRAQFV
jgi:hypothetical protein